MTAADLLAPIRERAEKATEGPWYAEVMGEHRADVLAPHEAGAFVICEHAGEDAEFIAAARTDVPRLLAALDAALALHFPEGDPDHSYADSCFECHDTSPCPTVAAVVAALQEGQ